MAEKKTYRTSVYIGTVDGKEIKKTVRANNQRELDKKVRDLKRAVELGKDLRSDSTFSSWADKWYREMKEPAGLSGGTLQQYRAALSQLLPVFGATEFKNISFSDFQQFINEYSATKTEQTGKVPSKATIYNVIKVYNAIADYAAMNGIPGAVHFKGVTVSKNAPVEKRRALTEKEIQWIVETEHPAQTFAMIMTFSGLRNGEVVPLMWSDIDLERNFIAVSKSVAYEGNQPVLKQGGKTRAAVRRVPIPPILSDYLRRLKGSGTVTTMLVCPNASGQMHTKTTFRKMWNNYIKTLNYKYGHGGVALKETEGQKDLPMLILPFTAYNCRHTFATLLFLQGVPVETAKQYLGHENISVTMDIYTDTKNNYRFDLTDTYQERLATDYKVRVS